MLFVGCGRNTRVSTAEDRAALFDYILEKTMEREAFSPIKNRTLNLDVTQNMRAIREEMIDAVTDEAMIDVLIRLSNARKDRHLSIDFVSGGLRPLRKLVLQAPIQFAVDYSTPGSYAFFISDYGKKLPGSVGRIRPEVGDKLLAVNGQPIDNYFAAIEPYIRYSTVNGLWWKFAEAISMKTYRIPPTLEYSELTCLLEREHGERFTVILPYLDADEIIWEGLYKGHGDPRYPGFKQVFSTETYDLYIREEGGRVLLLDWYGFREHLVEDVDILVAYAEEHDLLDAPILFDGTRSRGGSKGAYVLQRLCSDPFKTTFGNVRISDVTSLFIEAKRKAFRQQKIHDQGVKETIDDGTWLMAWLETDVSLAVEQRKRYSNNVPFKLAHLPKDSDGILEPTPVHFNGPLVCFFSPHGGSHLDQFAAMVVDNHLGYTLGMPCGGYSNTWEWEEILRFPISGKPVVKYMWSIGHTLRPNGEILEGNPASVEFYLPQSRVNYRSYYGLLIKKALAVLDVE